MRRASATASSARRLSSSPPARCNVAVPRRIGSSVSSSASRRCCLALPRGPRAGERQQDVRPALGRRRLGERARQVRRGARGRARALGGSRRLLEHVDDPRLAARRRVHELRGHRSRAGAATAQQPGGALVGERALVCGHVLVDGRADQRVRERRRRLVGEHLGADQLVGGDHGGGVVEAGELGDERERGGIAEHGGRVRHRRRVAAQAAEPHEHGARRGARRDRGDLRDVGGVRRDALGAQRLGQLDQQQRVAAGGVDGTRARRPRPRRSARRWRARSAAAGAG